ncbi:MAG: hypothetical protein H7Z16_18320 [Pyrinomonadaceae bacterium]|nr:hypothetical protein [Pyrinomonadaceae bacterium]
MSANAVATEAGVRIEWSSKFDIDNLGFNVYRLEQGKRIRINREIIPGSVFVAPVSNPRSNRPNAAAEFFSRAGYSYGWFDPAGTADSVYYIESVSVERVARVHQAVRAISETIPGGKQFPQMHPVAQTSEITTSGDNAENSFHETGYPAGNPSATSTHTAESTVDDQWSIAAQAGVKIAIRKDGWYRVTQPQMAAVGFNPAVDVRNLQLFTGGQEVAISTSQSGGLFGPADYIEFFGRGLDVPSSDVRTYYLIAAANPGKRVRGELQIDSLPRPSPSPLLSPTPQAFPSPISLPSAPSPATRPVPKEKWLAWLSFSGSYLIEMPVVPQIVLRADPLAAKPKNKQPPPDPPAVTPEPLAKAERLSVPPASAGGLSVPPASAGGYSYAVKPYTDASASDHPVFTLPPTKKTSPRNSRKRRGKTRLHRKTVEPKREYSHAVATAAPAPSGFPYTVEHKDRINYLSGLQNGDAENFFGQVISSIPSSQTITTPNPVVSATGAARLEIRLQGVNPVTHQVSVKFNDVVLGSMTFFGHEGPVRFFDVPVSQLQNGANTITFTPAAGAGTMLVAYVRVTYPRAFRAESDALKFSLLGTQTLQVDGFSSPAALLIDYTDPLNVGLTQPEIESSGGGYAITVPAGTPRSKAQRLFYATAAPAEQPAAISLNQPSALNLNTNAASFLIVTTNSLRASLAPLVAARQAQGMTVATVDVEDVYDEFGYGVHGPQAVKDFLARANSTWAGKPKYIVFAGDASYDPRNYLAPGDFDLVPTKLVDATFNETASDDWLADFDNDGIADVPIGRLPLRTAAEADVVVGKIVNFTPANVPQSAMLVADAQGDYYYSFEQANDQVQAQLPAGMPVQRVNIGTDGPGAARTNVIAGFNAGKALVTYTGHGNIDVWSGAAIFRTADATALTNGNKLSFVIVMDCLNGYFQGPFLLSLSEGFLKAPGGGGVAAFASSGLTFPEGQHAMSTQLYSLIYGAQPIALGDAIKIAKGATTDIDVRRTWIFFGDPSIKIR